MHDIFSHERFNTFYFCENRKCRDAGLLPRYKDVTYKIGIPLNLKDDDWPRFSSIKICTTNGLTFKRSVILKTGYSLPQPTCRHDRRKTGEFIFLLAAKLKYDLLNKKGEDHAGFLHTDEIVRLKNKGRTNVGKDIYRSLSQVSSEFLLKFLFDEVQLYHLLGYLGNTVGKKDDLVWWLNVSPENIEFIDNTGVIHDRVLKKYLDILFPKTALLSNEAKRTFYKTQVDKRVKKNKAIEKGPLVIANINSCTGQQSISLPQKPKYLRNIRDVLRFNGTDKSKWFRKTGPIAIDFAEEKVCPRKRVLDEIHKQVFGNTISMLEGNAGTGKSVLVRQFAYDLLAKDNKSKIYHYSFKSDLPVNDFREFKDEINSTSGVIIIEDIHLVTLDLQCILDELANENNGRVLFTARPSFRDNMLSSRSEKLKNLPSLTLGKQDDTKNIIEHYVRRQTTQNFKWKHKTRRLIREFSENNLWVLSYTLRGCTGQGEPLSWIERGVTEDLEEIEKLGYNPEILIALSPLFMSELLTAQTFLLKDLGFDRKEINALASQGEIIKHRIEKRIYYGLPHSSLAKAFWEHGSDYRTSLRYSEEEDFIYNYMVHDVCNGLEVCMKSKEKTRKSVLMKLHNENKIFEVIKKENSLLTFKSWIEGDSGITNLQIESLLDIISNKINEDMDLIIIPQCIEILCKRYKKNLWQYFDMNSLSSQLNKAKNSFYIGLCIGCIQQNDLEAGKRLCDMLDLKSLSTKLNQEESCHDIGLCVAAVYDVDSKMSKKLCSMVDFSSLANKLNLGMNSYAIGSCIDAIFESDRKRAKNLCKMLDIQKLSTILNQDKNSDNIIPCATIVSRADSETGKKLYELLDCQKTLKKIKKNKL